MKALDTFLKGPIMQKLLVLLFFSFAAHTALAQAGDKAKMERERQLLGQYIAGPENLIEQYLDFNQFKLHSNITAKLGNDGGYIAGHVRGDNWFYALTDKETCRLNWVLASEEVTLDPIWLQNH